MLDRIRYTGVQIAAGYTCVNKHTSFSPSLEFIVSLDYAWLPS